VRSNRSIPSSTLVPVLVYPDLRHAQRPPIEYGERQYSAEDLAGHRWTFSETLADVAPEEWGGTSVGR
jgi:hypothetical protein